MPSPLLALIVASNKAVLLSLLAYYHPVFVVFLAAAMERFLPGLAHRAPASNDVLIAPEYINLNTTDRSRSVEEFKLYGKDYIRCSALTKGLETQPELA